MISFNKQDDKMAEIARSARFFAALTKEDYRIYGLKKNTTNKPILIEFSPSSDVYDTIKDNCAILQKFFAANGIALYFGDLDTSDMDEESTDYKIYIGIRRDIRENVPLAVAILKTIVYFLEGKLVLTATSKLGDIPKFLK